MNPKRKLSLLALIILGAVAVTLAAIAMPKAHGESLLNQNAAHFQQAEADVPATGPAAPTVDPLPVPNEPFNQVLSFLSQGSNYIFAVYGIYDTGTKSAGAGIGAGYKLSEFVVPTLRLDYVNGQLWMPSGNLQLQLPLPAFKGVRVIPIATLGSAVPLGGHGSGNGTPVGIFGFGLAAQIRQHFDILGDVEKWTGFRGNQYRLGVAYKF